MTHAARTGRTSRSWRRLLPLGIVLVMLAGIGAAGGAVWQSYGERISLALGWQSNDFEGDGHGEVIVTIREGQIGEDVATLLAEAGVVKTAQAFYELLLIQATPVVFQVGSYQLKLEMSAQSALDALQDPGNLVELVVVIPEGFSAGQAFERIAEATGLPLNDFEDALMNPASFGVPEQFPSLEGFLFPASYPFDPADTAETIVQRLVDRMWQALDEHDVAAGDEWRVLTLASLVQKEAGSTEDMPKVARTFLNRIDIGMNLQSDATVSYGTGNPEGTVWTSDAERADATNPYNTYANPGLPVGPIGLPGDAAIDSVLHPAEGSWLFFVAVNLETGETAFADDEAGHQQNVTRLQQWCAQHESQGGSYCD